MSLFKSTCLVFALLVLSGCGFQPLYGKGSAGYTISEFSRIQIQPIKDRAGQLLHNQLLTSLNTKGAPGNPLYLLDILTDEATSSLAVRKSAFATRANLKVTANFRLLSTKGNKPLFSGTSAITVSYNILDSDFATLSAEKDARKRAVREIAEDIRIQLGTYFAQTRNKN